MGYVSQFLRAVPRVAALDVVAGPLIVESLMAEPAAREEARAAAAALLQRLAIPERLWQVPPVTFSGGEQQRVNIARGFLPERPLLLDEPTASLDAENRATVVELIAEKKRRGTAIVAIVHDEAVRRAIADDVVDVTRFSPAA
jgi:alpha-D-ribose 1-methylphosphonate 5-triphosphate synthase subunit PhnL